MIAVTPHGEAVHFQALLYYMRGPQSTGYSYKPHMMSEAEQETRAPGFVNVHSGRRSLCGAERRRRIPRRCLSAGPIGSGAGQRLCGAGGHERVGVGGHPIESAAVSAVRARGAQGERGMPPHEPGLGAGQ